MAAWSSESGYPGDFDYREFYRDIVECLEYLGDTVPDGCARTWGSRTTG